MHHFIIICEFKPESYSPETIKLGFDLCDLDLWPLTLTFCMDITLVIGNNSRKFHDDTMMGTLSKRSHRQTDILGKTQLYCDENRWRFFCLLRIIQESGVYQLGVPQGQGDSSASSTTDPLICGFCLVTTPNTRGKTVEQLIVTWMFGREFITNNRHPVGVYQLGQTDRQTDGNSHS